MMGSATERRESPLTGATVATERWYGVNWVWCFDETPALGHWALTASLADAGFAPGQRLRTRSLALTEQETTAVLALARSRVWGVNRLRPPHGVLFTGQDMVARVEAVRNRCVGCDEAWWMWTVEELHAEARRLTLREKAVRTLGNLALAEREVGHGVQLAVYLDPPPGEIGPASAGYPSVLGIAYGCTEGEAHVVFQDLRDRGWVVSAAATQARSSVCITSTGYAQLEAMAAGGPFHDRAG